jgi:TetR/AcrR family transcriptional repressor of nem operon
LVWETALRLDTSVRGAVVYRPIGQMPSQKDTRKRLVQTALRLFASRGYYNTGIADILRESGCKRGTLYHYFSSKEDLGYAAIDESVRLLLEQSVLSPLGTKEDPIDRLLRVMDALPSRLDLDETETVTAGIGARMATVHEGFRQRVVERLSLLVDEIERMIRKGIADGQIADTVEPRRLAHTAVIFGHGLQTAGLLEQREIEEAQRWARDYLNSLRR